MDEWLKFVSSVGVPAAIAFFVLWRVDGHLVELRNELRELHLKIGTLLDELTRRA